MREWNSAETSREHTAAMASPSSSDKSLDIDATEPRLLPEVSGSSESPDDNVKAVENAADSDRALHLETLNPKTDDTQDEEHVSKRPRVLPNISAHKFGGKYGSFDAAIEGNEIEIETGPNGSSYYTPSIMLAGAKGRFVRGDDRLLFAKAFLDVVNQRVYDVTKPPPFLCSWRNHPRDRRCTMHWSIDCPCNDDRNTPAKWSAL